jgi:solute carrier family 45 protein 1/2/4
METNKVVVAEVWPLWKLVLIALPQLGIQVLWCFIGPNSVPYMLHLGMGPALATLNNVAGPITGFFTGPIVGATSDNCTSRFGRRRPVIVAGLISTWVAGTLFAASEHLFDKHTAIYFAAPMYWIMDVTINILQTPHRALVADLATEEQQVPMQVVFVFMMAVGNFLAFCIYPIYPVPVEHMLELMLYICLLNTVCVLIQFSVVREKPLTRDFKAAGASLCAPVLNVVDAVKSSPFVLWHLAAVQCLVWMGNTSWNLYGGQWFSNSVHEGDLNAPAGSDEKIAYAEGQSDFGLAGRCKAGLQLVSSLTIIAILLKTTLRPRFVYAPCIYIGR